MDLTDTKKVLAYVAAAYPRYFANVSRASADRQAIVWQDALGEYSVDAVMTGVKSYITADSSGFPPSPGQIIGHIFFVGSPRDHSGTEAWALVRRAINCPWDQFEAAFQTLPRAAQIAVGSPDSLKELAQMDIGRFETVAQSNFLRMYETARKQEAKEQMIPRSAISMRERLQMELEAKRNLASGRARLEAGNTCERITADQAVENPRKEAESERTGGGHERLMEELRARLNR